MSRGDVGGDDRSLAAASDGQSERRPRPLSLKSLRSRSSFGRSRSRPREPDREAQLNRIYSFGFQDDHSTYIGAYDDVEHTPTADPEPGTASSSAEEVEKGQDLEEVESQDFEPDTERAGDRTTEHEKAPSLKRQQTSKSARSQRERDPNMVSWNGPDDPENPKNWPNKRKWLAVLVVSSFTFISPVSSSMVAPALPAMDRDLGVTGQVTSQMNLSIFILAYAIGPLFLGPLSEVYGRVPVLQLANLFFLIFNLVCGFAQNSAQMLVFRFFAGIGGSAPLAIGGGILADCFRPEERGKAIGIYSLAPLIGPAGKITRLQVPYQILIHQSIAGPIAGGFIAENTTWRWVFWAVSIADAVIQLFGLFYLQETWAPKLLEIKTRKLRKQTGNNELYAELSKNETVLQKLETSLVRPFRLLFTQPTIQVLAVYMAYLYGLVYLVISSFPGLFTSPDYYNESVGIGGLHYLALAVGYFIGAQATARFNDWLYRRLKRRNNGVGKPEFRIPAMIPCAILLPAGFFWYGWSAEARLHWIMPDIGAALLAGATICGYYSIQNYVIDCYSKYAASAVAAMTTLRSLAGFGFPLFAPALYGSLGYGLGNSVLAIVAIAIGVPAPWILWKYGARLRAKSQYAAGGN